jgi:hypothetical protein
MQEIKRAIALASALSPFILLLLLQLQLSAMTEIK